MYLLDNNQSPRQTIHNLRVLLLCVRAVRGLLVGSCLMHVCAHYSRAESTPLGPVSSRTRHIANLQHKQPKPWPHVTRLLACLDFSPPFVRIVASALRYTAHCCICRLLKLSNALKRARGGVHSQKGHIAKV